MSWFSNVWDSWSRQIITTVSICAAAIAGIAAFTGNVASIKDNLNKIFGNAPSFTYCAPILLTTGQLDETCGLSPEQARSTTRSTLGNITNKVALVLSEKDFMLFPPMKAYLQETDETKRVNLWKKVQEGASTLVNLTRDASTALENLDAKLRAQAGVQLAHDPQGVRDLLIDIQTRAFGQRVGNRRANK